MSNKLDPAGAHGAWHVDNRAEAQREETQLSKARMFSCILVSESQVPPTLRVHLQGYAIHMARALCQGGRCTHEDLGHSQCEIWARSVHLLNGFSVFVWLLSSLTSAFLIFSFLVFSLVTA